MKNLTELKAKMKAVEVAEAKVAEAKAAYWNTTTELAEAKAADYWTAKNEAARAEDTYLEAVKAELTNTIG